MELRDEYHVALDRLSNFAHALIKAVELEKAGNFEDSGFNKHEDSFYWIAGRAEELLCACADAKRRVG
jgi:hypothetical protein